jgi:hypothetical protein
MQLSPHSYSDGLADERRTYRSGERMAGHSYVKTTGLYDRRNDDVGVGEI